MTAYEQFGGWQAQALLLAAEPNPDNTLSELGQARLDMAVKLVVDDPTLDTLVIGRLRSHAYGHPVDVNRHRASIQQAIEQSLTEGSEVTQDLTIRWAIGGIGVIGSLLACADSESELLSVDGRKTLHIVAGQVEMHRVLWSAHMAMPAVVAIPHAVEEPHSWLDNLAERAFLLSHRAHFFDRRIKPGQLADVRRASSKVQSHYIDRRDTIRWLRGQSG